MTETPRKLTLKQENFVTAYMETGIAAEAYRQAYATENMKEKVIRNNASAQLRHNGIAMAIQAKKDAKQADNKALEDRAKEFSEECIQTAAKIMRDNDAPQSARMAAIKELLDRGHGKPISKTELDATLKSSNAGADELSDEALMALLAPQGEG